jgi:NADPH2:quinone reductase
LTAWEALLENAHIPANHEANKGKSILIVGGAGGVGSFAIQIA